MPSLWLVCRGRTKDLARMSAMCAEAGREYGCDTVRWWASPFEKMREKIGCVQSESIRGANQEMNYKARE